MHGNNAYEARRFIDAISAYSEGLVLAVGANSRLVTDLSQLPADLLTRKLLNLDSQSMSSEPSSSGEQGGALVTHFEGESIDLRQIRSQLYANRAIAIMKSRQASDKQLTPACSVEHVSSTQPSTASTVVKVLTSDEVALR